MFDSDDSATLSIVVSLREMIVSNMADSELREWQNELMEGVNNKQKFHEHQNIIIKDFSCLFFWFSPILWVIKYLILQTHFLWTFKYFDDPYEPCGNMDETNDTYFALTRFRLSSCVRSSLGHNLSFWHRAHTASILSISKTRIVFVTVSGTRDTNSCRYVRNLSFVYETKKKLFHLRRANVAQRQSVGFGNERYRVRNSLVPSGFSFRQGN